MEQKSITRNDNYLERLIGVIETLRGKDGCPWDKKQTPESMALYLKEELYELLEAIESGSSDDVCEELGDVLFQILFIARIFQETGRFDIQEVARVTCEKMITRHPHVFGGDKVDSVEQVKQRWHEIKKTEKNHSENESVLDSVPSRQPPLMRAYRISERAARSGFDWDDIGQVLIKSEEEWAEFKSELEESGPAGPDKNRAGMELGDVLFTLTNVARFAGIHPETALIDSINKFEKRFRYMEKKILAGGKCLELVSSEEKERLWEEAKKAIG